MLKSGMAKQTPAERKARKAAYARAYYLANRDRVAAINRAYYVANLDKYAAYGRAYRSANRDKVAACKRAHKAANRDEIAAYERAWAVANPDKRTAITARRKAAKLQRTPPWADHERIGQVYTLAADMAAKTGESWHVDHIIPLQGKLVSGLHVYENLQILTASENCRKNNRFDPADMY